MNHPAHIEANENGADLGGQDYRELPHNLEVEQALLGAILTNNNAMDKVSGFLKEEHFSEAIHGRIFADCKALIDKGRAADPVKLKDDKGLCEALEDVGGASYLVRLAASAATIINAQDYGVTIYELALRRELIQLGEKMVLDAYDAPVGSSPSDQIEAVEQTLHELGARGEWGVRVKSFDEAGREALDAVEAAHVMDGPPGLTTGLMDLDRRIGGLFNTDLVIIGGRSGHLKSTLATTIAAAAAQSLVSPHPLGRVLFFSLEMSGEQLAQRMISDMARRLDLVIDYDRARKGRLSKSERETLNQCYVLHRSLPLHIIDKASMSLARISGLARRLQRDWENRGQPLRLIIIDYLQLIAQPRGMSKFDHVSECSRGLKVLAKDLEVPVVALSQLNRDLEKRDNKRPQLSDLRQSGTIEEDADMVLFCYRHIEYLKKEEPKAGTAHDTWVKEMEAARNAFELIVGKQRHGPTGTIELIALPDTASIRDKAQGELLDG